MVNLSVNIQILPYIVTNLPMKSCELYHEISSDDIKHHIIMDWEMVDPSLMVLLLTWYKRQCLPGLFFWAIRLFNTANVGHDPSGQDTSQQHVSHYTCHVIHAQVNSWYAEGVISRGSQYLEMLLVCTVLWCFEIHNLLNFVTLHCCHMEKAWAKVIWYPVSFQNSHINHLLQLLSTGRLVAGGTQNQPPQTSWDPFILHFGNTTRSIWSQTNAARFVSMSWSSTKNHRNSDFCTNPGGVYQPTSMAKDVHTWIDGPGQKKAGSNEEWHAFRVLCFINLVSVGQDEKLINHDESVGNYSHLVW